MSTAYVKEMSTTDALSAALKADPSLTARDLAERFGISKQRVHQALASAEVKAAQAPRGPRRPAGEGSRCHAPAWTNGLGSPGKLPTSVIGAALEMLVAADLMKRGAYVYRALSHTCPADMIAWMGERLIRVEVRAGRRDAAGRLSYSPPDASRYDVLAVVDPDGLIVYKPDLPAR
jgi:hypothetical protein